MMIGGIKVDKPYNDLIGDMLKKNNYEYEKDLPGKGKPLPKDYIKKDTFQHFQKIAKDAGYLPPWLKLQKEIAELLQRAGTEEDLNEINVKIKEHNQICPSQMQKGPVNKFNLERMRKSW